MQTTMNKVTLRVIKPIQTQSMTLRDREGQRKKEGKLTTARKKERERKGEKKSERDRERESTGKIQETARFGR